MQCSTGMSTQRRAGSPCTACARRAARRPAACHRSGAPAAARAAGGRRAAPGDAAGGSRARPACRSRTRGHRSQRCICEGAQHRVSLRSCTRGRCSRRCACGSQGRRVQQRVSWRWQTIRFRHLHAAQRCVLWEGQPPANKARPQAATPKAAPAGSPHDRVDARRQMRALEHMPKHVRARHARAA